MLNTIKYNKAERGIRERWVGMEGGQGSLLRPGVERERTAKKKKKNLKKVHSERGNIACINVLR